MLRFFAVIVGVFFIFIGVAGFMPNLTYNHLLFNYFPMTAMLAIAYILTGIFAIMAATTRSGTRFFFKVFGLIYLIAAILGYWRSGDLYIMQVLFFNDIFHLIIGIIFLYLGFRPRSKTKGV